jgi:hypothetical protein
MMFLGGSSAQLTCGDLKSVYQDNACCTASLGNTVTGLEAARNAPPLPGIQPGAKSKINLAYDIWSPYIYLHDATKEPTGFGVEFVKLMQKSTHPTCTMLDISMIQDQWSRMWFDSTVCAITESGAPSCNEIKKLGDGVNYGLYHGGMTYTHLKGLRPRTGDFTWAITKPASQSSGILVKLNSDGEPKVSALSDLSGMKIVDVAGYAPTTDTFGNVQNHCNGQFFADPADITWVVPTETGNKAAMAAFKNDATIDLMWVYSGQAEACIGAGFQNDCEGWEGFGTEFAYLHTGLMANQNGTTIAFSKKNSGVNELLNPCIQHIMETKEYHDICTAPLRPPTDMSTNFAVCYPNSFWNQTELAMEQQGTYQNNHVANSADSPADYACEHGYCQCSELPGTA